MLSSLHNRGYRQRELTLPVLVGVMLSLFAVGVQAQTDSVSAPAANVPEVSAPVAIVPEVSASEVTTSGGQTSEVSPAAQSQFAWYAHAELDANYVWRGLYCGGLSLQAEAEVSYYGFYINSWWNIGATDWQWGKRDANGRPVTGLNPEVDMYIGYRYKGFKVLFMHMYYFDRYADGSMSRYFDFGNHEPGGGGVTTEWRVGYRISDRVPLQFLWCTRTFGRDGYMVGGELRRAYSTYIEVRYDQSLPHDFVLSGVVGMTPWKSMYTGYQKNFAVVNLQVGLNKSWQVANGMSVDVGGVVVLNPSSMQPLWNVHAGVTWN